MTLARLSGVTLLVLAGLLWLVLVAAVATLNSSDPAGNAMTYSYAVLMTIALWILLGALLLVTRPSGAIPGWVGVGAFVLVPLAGAAAIAAIDLLQRRVDVLAKWPIVTPVLAPLALMLSAAWSLFPGMRSAMTANTANIVWGALLVLSLLPWPALYWRSRTRGAQADASRVATADAATIEWLTAHGCDCEAAVTAYETTARLYPDSPQRTALLGKLAPLHR